MSSSENASSFDADESASRKSRTLITLFGEDSSSADALSLSTSSASSAEVIRIEELTEELRNITTSDADAASTSANVAKSPDNITTSDTTQEAPVMTPTTEMSKSVTALPPHPTVADRLSPLVSSLAASAAYFFSFTQPLQNAISMAASLPQIEEARSAAHNIQQPTTYNNNNCEDFSKLEPLKRHVSCNGIEYMRFPFETQIGSLQAAVYQLQTYCEEYVENRHEIIVHLFPQRVYKPEENALDVQLSYYSNVISTIAQCLQPLAVPAGADSALESLRVTLSTSEETQDRSLDLSDLISELSIAVYVISEHLVEIADSSALQKFGYFLLKLRFVNESGALQFRNAFNNATRKMQLKQIFDGYSRVPFCHFTACEPERRLRAALIAHCRQKNGESLRMAAAHGFDVSMNLKYVTNGLHIFKKIIGCHGTVGSAKISIDTQSLLGKKRGAIFTLSKYAGVQNRKKNSIIIRNLPEVFDMSTVNALVRRVLRALIAADDKEQSTTTIFSDEIVAIERIGVQRRPSAAFQEEYSRLVRVTLANAHTAKAFKQTFNAKIRGKNLLASGVNFDDDAMKFDEATPKVPLTFAHGDMTPPELVLHRHVRDYCRVQNAKPVNLQPYRYFHRETELMRVRRT